MKYQVRILFLLIFVLGISPCKVIAQQIYKEEDAKDLVTPLDSVPQWVQDKVTPEEYRLWQTMSRIFQINYSFLNRDFPSEKREQFYNDIKQLCESIERGECSYKKGELFAVSLPAAVDTTLTWRVDELNQIDDNIQFCKRRSIIYRSEHWEKIYLECSVWYIYNSQTKDINIIKYEVLSPSSFSRFQGAASFSLQSDRTSLKGNCSGTIEYYDEEHEYQSETIYKSFIIPLSFCEDKN